MNIVMWCGGMPFDGDTVKHSSLGGSESAAYYMANELADLGYKVTLFTSADEAMVSDKGVKYQPCGQFTDQSPLGDNFHFFAENTPHDVLIVQRHPMAFKRRFASKLNLWWLHDLPDAKNKGHIQGMMYNVDGVLVVSEFHKQKVVEAYDLKPEVVHVVHNGIDLSLFGEGRELFKEGEDVIPTSSVRYDMQGCREDGIRLLYTSRPERGLEHLVGPGGIMERLSALGERHHLYVCGYDNTTSQTRAYYDSLYQRCDELPNVTVLGALTKQELADVMRQCDALVYPCPGPTIPEFDEVSCITAMECMAAGLPFISSDRGALPETCDESGSILLSPKDDGMPDIDQFVEAVASIDIRFHSMLREKQLNAAGRFTWSNACEMLMDAIEACFLRATDGRYIAQIKHMVRHSDVIPALSDLAHLEANYSTELVPVVLDTIDELHTCYEPIFENQEEYYEQYYEEEARRGVDYGPEDVSGDSRFIAVLIALRGLPAGSTVLDYGCAHGHYTINLAKQFPDLRFIGVDLVVSNIERANKWAEGDGVENVKFIHAAFNDGAIRTQNGQALSLTDVDALLVAEVLEHVADPVELIDGLVRETQPAKVVITTPYGPWEAQGYVKHWPMRNHLWHFERYDVVHMFGHHPGFKFNVVPAGFTAWGDPVGSFVYSFDTPNEPSVNPKKDIAYVIPTLQTLSVCMIVKDAEDTLMRTLKSIQDVATEVIIRVDPTTTDKTLRVVDRFRELRPLGYPTVRCYTGDTPVTDIGFDEARNETIDMAQCDWVLWIDADESLVSPEGLFRFMRSNMFDGYAITHNHISSNPAGLFKTDYPCRMFRNTGEVKFFGVVHEHPEVRLNEGVGHTLHLPDVSIAHYGYYDESTRQQRFYRNIPLLVRDREKYPDRTLGKFLWMRDLSQMCQMELTNNGGRVTQEMRNRAAEGIAIWEELLNSEYSLRLAVDGLEFYSVLNSVLGTGFEASLALDTSDGTRETDLGSIRQIKAFFTSKEHLEKLFNAILTERVKGYAKV